MLRAEAIGQGTPNSKYLPDMKKHYYNYIIRLQASLNSIL